MFGLATLFVVCFFLSLAGSGLLKSGIVHAEEFTEVGEIKTDNQEYTITFKKDQTVYYKITPVESAYYTIQITDALSSTYIYFYDSNKVRKTTYVGNYMSRLLEKGTTYYLGFSCTSLTEDKVDKTVKIYAPLGNYSQGFASSIFVRNNVVTADDLDANMYYTSGGKKYKANCTVQYRKYSSYTASSPSGEYIDGIPTTLGKYTIYFTAVSPFTGKANRTVRIYDISEFSKYPIYTNEQEGYYYDGAFCYTGKEFDLSNIWVTRNDEVMELGKQYKYDGYCTKNVYELLPEKNIKWKTSKPVEPGDYYIKLSGIGECKGTQYYSISIRKAIDFDYAVVNDIKTANETLELKRGGLKVYRICPAKSGKYTISIKRDSDVISASIYDKKGGLIDVKKTDPDKDYTLTLEENLSEGETYYISINDNRYYYNDAEVYEATISIPGYSFYVPPKKTDNTDKDKDGNNPKKQGEKDKSSASKPLAKGKTFKVGGMTYKVTSSKKGNYKVALIKNNKKTAKNITVKDSVKYKGVTYKITSIGSSAFKNNKKLVNITLGKNITKIGKPAFKGCTKLKKVKVPKKKLSSYKRLLKKAGLSSDVEVTYK